jgi:hypothetical protein
MKSTLEIEIAVAQAEANAMKARRRQAGYNWKNSAHDAAAFERRSVIANVYIAKLVRVNALQAKLIRELKAKGE